MPVTLALLDLDAEYEKVKDQAIIINDMPNQTEADQKYFNDMVRQVFNSDLISLMPTCACSKLRGENRVGKICSECGTPVQQKIEDDIRSMLWFRKPAGIKRLILPYVLTILRTTFAKRNFNVIRWLIDRSYNPIGLKSPILTRLIADDVPRGYNNFVDNFFTIIPYLLTLEGFNKEKYLDRFIKGMLRPERPIEGSILMAFLEDNRDRLFSDYLPIQNRALMVIEQSKTKDHVEKQTLYMHNALNTMRSIDQDHFDMKPAAIENRTARILMMLSDYELDYVDNNIQPKGGLPRKNLYGARAITCFRAVITSHSGIADHDEIHLPWSPTIACFEHHIRAILMKPHDPDGGMTHAEASRFVLDTMYVYDERMHRVLNRLIEDTTDGYIHVLAQRNQPNRFPSAVMLSTQSP